MRKRGLCEEQPLGRYPTWVGVGAEAGVLARVIPSPETQREACARPGTGLGSGALGANQTNPHPQGFTVLWERDTGHNHNLIKGVRSHKAWWGLRGPSRPWGVAEARGSDQGIIISQ